ncbi:MAG: hypothetical protein SGJ02_10880 [bacterium]|nr:hypothetical protein [bacterium]
MTKSRQPSDRELLLDLKDQVQALKELVLEMRRGVTQNISDTVGSKANIPHVPILKSFKWKGSNNHLKSLHRLLVNEGIIASVNEALFKSAFSEEQLSADLGIVWQPLTPRDEPNKVELFFFIDTLINRQLIEDVFPETKTDSAIFYKRIKRIFVDSNGEPFGYLKQSFKTFRDQKLKNATISVVKKKQDNRDIGLMKDIVRTLSKRSNPDSDVKKLTKYVNSAEHANVVKYQQLIDEVMA